MTRSRNFAMIAALLVVVFAGCRKQFDVPEYENVDTNETAYVIKIEGSAQQAKFDSAASLEKLKVATKRIRITHRWNQTDRWESEGEWIPDVRVIKVNRSPVTREWTAGTGTGTTNKDQAIWAESKDSVGFSTGFSVSANIEEAKASLFLYKYTSKSLSTIMDTEIRARVQSAFSDAASKFTLSDLRAHKNDVIEAVRADVIPFFDERGITITTLGMFGGLKYENALVQASIDKVFIAQREKEISAAQLAAQFDKNKQIEMEADALAQKERKIAQGIADGKQMLLEVAKNAGKDPAFLELRRLEVEEKRIEKWNGQYPSYYMTMGQQADAPTLMLQVPSVEPQRAAHTPVVLDASDDTTPVPVRVVDPNFATRQKLSDLVAELRLNHSQARAGAYRNNVANKLRVAEGRLRNLK